MDVASFAGMMEDGALVAILFILGLSWLWALWSSMEHSRTDICMALVVVPIMGIFVWKICAPSLTFFDFFKVAVRGTLGLLTSAEDLKALAILIFFIFSATVFCAVLAFTISQRFVRGLPTVLGAMDASRGRQYDQLRAEVVAADGVIVENNAVRRGRLEKSEFVCEDGTRYALEGALLAHNPPRLILHDGRTLRLGRKNAPRDMKLAAVTGRVRIPPPLPRDTAPPAVDMRRWEDDMQW